MTVLSLLFLCSLAQAPDIGPRVEELLLDLEDPALAPAARIELLALGDLAAVDVAERCIWPPRHSGCLPRRCWTPVLQAMGAQARPALTRAVAVAVDAELDGSTRGRAQDLVEALALTVPADATVLARLPESVRLRARVTLGAQPADAALHAALQEGDAFAVEAALEVLARRGSPAPRFAERVAELWVNRLALDVPEEVHADVLHEAIAEALVVVAPDHPQAASAHGWILGIDRPAPDKLAAMAAIVRLRERAGDAVPALADACLHFDDAVCRGALESIATLGAVAAGALPAVEDRVEHAADDEIRRLARIARRRLKREPADEARVADLIDELLHAGRWQAAALELGALGAPAARALLAFTQTTAARHAGEVPWDILRALGPSLATVLPAHMEAAGDREEAGWHRLARLVDLAVDSGNDEVARRRDRAAGALGRNHRGAVPEVGAHGEVGQGLRSRHGCLMAAAPLSAMSSSGLPAVLLTERRELLHGPHGLVSLRQTFLL